MNFTLIERLCLEESPTYQPRILFDGPASDGTAIDVEPFIAKEQLTTSDGSFRFASISDYYHQYRFVTGK